MLIVTAFAVLPGLSVGRNPEDFANRPGHLDSLHPDITLASLLPEGTFLKVAGMDWLPDGAMAILSIQDTILPIMGGGKGSVFILSGARSAPMARPVLREAYYGFENPLGLAVAGGAIHVSQRRGLVRLEDGNADGRFDSLARVAPYPDSDWERWGKWAMGVVHRDGFFYTGLGADHWTGPEGPCLPWPERGMVHKVDARGNAEGIGTGLREPFGIGFGPEGDLFATDNDGEWVPANRLVHVRRGEFYGLVPCGAWQAGLASTPPAVWFPKHLRSPGQPLLLSHGPFRGQMVVGDYNILNLSRIFLEKVDGRYQGALFPFTGGLASGGLRFLQDEAGAVYVGELTNDTHESWFVGQPKHPLPGGLEKLVFTGSTAFEMLAIRALADGFELEFTRPVAPGEADPARYRVTQWRLEPTRNYGGPVLDAEILPVGEVRLSEDGRKVSLRIPGLKAGRVVHVQLHDGFRSAEGKSPWAYEAWYTLNAFQGRVESRFQADPRWEGPRMFLRGSGSGTRVLDLELRGPGDLCLRDLAGRTVFKGSAFGKTAIALPKDLPADLYLVDIRAEGRVFHRRLHLF